MPLDREARTRQGRAPSPMRRVFCFLSVIACVAALAPAVRADDVKEISCEGPFQGDDTRYPNMRVVPRFARDFLALPGSVVAWDNADWARFGAFSMPTAALMLKLSPVSSRAHTPPRLMARTFI